MFWFRAGLPSWPTTLTQELETQEKKSSKLRWQNVTDAFPDGSAAPRSWAFRFPH